MLLVSGGYNRGPVRVRPRLGLQIPVFSFEGVPPDRLFDKVVEIALAAEGAGFDSVWVHDHLHQSPYSGAQADPILEAYTLLGAIAARTSDVAVGSMVTPVTTRHPALIAKMVTTLDVISSGRAVLGLGAGNHPDEHRAYGLPFPSAGERIEWLEDALQICRAMFTHEETSFESRRFQLHGAMNVPQPIQPGGPPIMVGGGGERRTLALAARFADICGFFGDASTIRRKVAIVDRHCEDVGRDPSTLAKTRLGALVIAPTQREADEIGLRMKAARRMSDDFYQEAIVGDPDRVSEQVQVFLDAGLDGMFFNMHDPERIEHVTLAGETLSKLFA
jgi:F420-dependent oxidoreductase-like protein